MPRPERPVDPKAGVTQRFAFELRALRRRAGSPGYRELARKAHYSATTLAQAARGDTLPSLAVTLAYVRACGGAVAEWEDCWRAAAEELEPATRRDIDSPDPTAGRPPYVGLAAFSQADAERFFGRDQLIGKIIDMLATQRFVAVVGASGSGKSSLLRAGLLPAVAADVSAVLITPGAHPLQECAVRLGAELGVPPGRLVADFAEHPRNLGLAIRQILAKQPADGDFLLVVDQFEEVFSRCGDAAERSQFIAALLAAAHDQDNRIRVVLGLRADFYGRCAQHPGLAQALAKAQVPVTAMTTDELREAITRPAISAGCTVETTLVARLIADATAQPGVLPFLSLALLETWRRRRGNTLTLAGYEAAGGVHRAIVKNAEHTYLALDVPQRRHVRQLFLRLTALGVETEDHKRRISRDELDNNDSDVAVLNQLAAARLITLDRGSVEVAHEALIRAWPRLREWLAEKRDGLRIHRQLTEAANAWETLDRDAGALYRGARLISVQQWARNNDAALTERERAFLTVSLSAQAEEQAVARDFQRLRKLVVPLTALLMVAAITAVYAVSAQQATARQQKIASSELVASEAYGLRIQNPELAVQFSLTAYRLAPTANARHSLLSTFGTYARTLTFTHGIRLAAVSGDGRTVAAASADHTVVLWDLTNPDAPRGPRTFLGHAAKVIATALSADGSLLAVAGEDHTIQLWWITDHQNPQPLGLLTGTATALAFHPNGHVLAVAGKDNIIQLWRINDHQHPEPPRRLTGHQGTISSLAFSSDGQRLASASWDETVWLWDLTNPDRASPAGVVDGHTNPMALGAHDRTIATASHGEKLRLWDVTQPNHPRQLTELPKPAQWAARVPDDFSGANQLGTTAGNILLVAISLDGRTVATGRDDGTVMLWDITNPLRPVPLATLIGHSGPITRMVFGPDGQTLITASNDSTVKVWDIDVEQVANKVCEFVRKPATPDQWQEHAHGLPYQPPCG